MKVILIMQQLRDSKGFYIKAYNIPVNKFKSVCFNRLKNKFQAILVTQIVMKKTVPIVPIILQFKMNIVLV